jgi:hypothetical protein
MQGKAMDHPPPITDSTLAKWKAGDRRAFLAAVGPWLDRVYRIVDRIVGTSHDAEEVFQTLMLRLLRSDVAQPPATGFPGWIRRCAVNEAITFLRRRQRAIDQAGRSEAVGEGPFYLSVRTGERLLGVDKSTVSRWLFLLVHDRILDLVSVGNQRERKASRFRYIAESKT